MRVRRLLLAAGGLALAAALLFLLRQRPGPPGMPDHGEDPVEDPRVTYATPFRNVRPDVKYLGDEACAGCHGTETRSFHQHPMGRSVTPAAVPTQGDGPAAHNPFERAGRSYRVERREGRTVHREVWTDSRGRTLGETEAEVSYAAGSGTRAHSYLFTRGDYLFQSPITWYAQARRWDLSPGYEDREDRFERPVQAECLFCHCNHVEPVKDTLNQFRPPLFPRGAAIGCERCHGPGELHVRERRSRREVPEGADHSIVNPRHLEPELREAVCQQCHLEGERRVLRRGRQPFDYRPGLPLHLFWSVFVAPPDLTEHGTFVGQVEQMHASRCFTGSEGRLGCASCHDPHRLPAPEEKAAYYRRRCLECHREQGCSLSEQERRAKRDDCAACHVSRIRSTNVNHVAITDHRIPRHAAAGRARPAARPLRPGEIPLVHFHRGLVERDDPEVQRDLGLALVEMARLPTPAALPLGDAAFPLLESALARWPRDPAAREGLAFLLGQQGRHGEALEVVRQVVSRSPRHETALTAAAHHAEKAGKVKDALEYARRAVEVNPWSTPSRLRHATLLNLSGEYDAALAECREALRFNPGSVKVRSLLVSCYLKKRERARAEEEFATLLKLNPPNREELQQWFERQPR